MLYFSMDDIRRIRKGPQASERLSEILRSEDRRRDEKESAIEQVFADAQKIDRPKKSRRWLMGVLVLVVVLIGGIWVYMSFTSYKVYNDKYQIPNKSQINPKSKISNPKKDISEKIIFDTDRFYGVSTDERLYFGRIVESNDLFYRIEDVFYEVNKTNMIDGLDKADRFERMNATDTTDGSNKITLVKFGTEDYQPEGELVLPREQVKQIFPLRDDSPISQAIKQYFNENE